MISQLGWVDFSPTDRDRVRQVLSQLHLPGTLDELGIGAIRDGFADLLFPGFSTIQTRARYLLVVPRILRDYERLRPRNLTLEQYLKERENRVAAVLVKHHGIGEETGIIGATRVNSGGVDRRPSSVYWNAYRVWGIIDTSKSLAQFCNSYRLPDIAERLSLDMEADDHDAMAMHQIIHLDRSDYPDDWLEHLSLRLHHDEAVFLAEKIRRGKPHLSVPVQLFQHSLLAAALEESGDTFRSFAAWACQQSSISEITRRHLAMADAFSEAMYGAHIRFNYLLAEHSGQTERMDGLKDDWSQWFKSNAVNPQAIDDWFSVLGPRLSAETARFVRAWCGAVHDRVSVPELDNMIRQQALRNKKERSLLRRGLNPDHQWVGMGRLSYRWEKVRIILGDIQEGLNDQAA